MAGECCSCEAALQLRLAVVAGTKEALEVIIIMLMGVDDHNLLIW